MGFGEPHIRLMFYLVELGFPRNPHISAYICGSSGWASVVVRPWKAGNYPPKRQLVRFRIVWMAFRIRDNHEMGRARAPTSLDVIATLRNNKAASLLHLSSVKVSSTKDLLNRQTCQGILCVSTYSPHSCTKKPKYEKLDTQHPEPSTQHTISRNRYNTVLRSIQISRVPGYANSGTKINEKS